MNNQNLVSIIIRTCGKPYVLHNALQSVRNQTYSNIEVIIVEDGPNISEEYVQKNFSDLDYRYFANGTNLGRTQSGNIGLSMATGKYINFLDEDDILLKNHVEILVTTLNQSMNKVAYSVAEEHQIKVKSLAPYIFKVKRTLIRYRHPFNRLLLSYMNLFPIQSVMFERSMFEQFGGFDESLDVLEDWDLWVRYAINEPFCFVDEVTSIYYTPYKNRRKHTRECNLKDAEQSIKEKYRIYNFNVDVKQLNSEMDYVLNVFDKKGLIFYLKKIQNYLLYRDR